MLKKHAQIFEALFIAADLLVVTLSWLISYGIRFFLDVLPVDKGIPPFKDYVTMLVFVWLIWAFIFKRNGLYKPARGRNIWSEVFILVRANAFSVVLLIAATYLFKEKSVPFSRLVFVIFFIFQTSFSIIVRLIIRKFLRKMRRQGYNIRYALIVGAGDLAKKIASNIIDNRELGIELIGFLSSSKEDFSQCDEAAPIIGTYEDVGDIVERGGVDQVIIALPLEDQSSLKAVIRNIGDSVVDVKLIPDVHQFIQLGSEIEEFDGLPVISLASTPLDGFNRILKRGVDLILGIIIFLIFFVPMLVIALIVKLTSEGPIFYRQDRLGLDGKVFPIIKFRTMFQSPNSEVYRFTSSDDSRVTSVGKVLRRWSLDELPQLWNVIMGNMSLVGPRPERPLFIEEFRKRVPKYMLRHKVQAGMTGWAQVNGWRGDTSIEKRIEHDLFYIENWSLSLDFKILWLTIFKGFKNRNAY